jgi:hypothetical protein
MPGSVTSVFSEAQEFEAALLEKGNLGLLIIGPGVFRARLTQVAQGPSVLACTRWGILTRFEDLLHTEAFPGMTELCAPRGSIAKPRGVFSVGKRPIWVRVPWSGSIL